MAQVATPTAVVGQKRGPGRPPKDPAAKKAKISTTTSTTQSSPVQSPNVDASLIERSTSKLPIRTSDSRPLPTLSDPQSSSLSDQEYRSIAASAVLAASLERSRQRWMIDGIFERVAVKSSKNVNGIDLRKDYEDFGQCRIRVEPHMFEVNVWVQKQPVYRPPPKAPITNWNSGATYGQYNKHYNTPSQTQYRTPVQPRQTMLSSTSASASSPALSQASVSNHATGSSAGIATQSKQSSQPQSSTSQDEKPSPDPVISMLATRASSDPELKALMKEVATGKATADQLKIFQRHIDELTQVIEQKKINEDALSQKQQVQTPAPQAKLTHSTPVSNVNTPAPAVQSPKPAVPTQQTPSTPYSNPQPYQWHAPPPQPPPPITREVIFQFKSPGANDDKFRFPQYSILEYLSAQHCLASFIVTRKGRDGIDLKGLNPDTEYWQPVTLLIECAYGRDHILAHVNKYVKSADDVRKHMEGIMKRCTRAPESYLALRLPLKGTSAAESEVETAEGTPALEEKVKAKYSTKATMKMGASSLKKKQMVIEGDNTKAETTAKEAPKSLETNDSQILPATATNATEGEVAPKSADAKTETVAAADNGGRPRRAVRKSVRISEG